MKVLFCFALITLFHFTTGIAVSNSGDKCPALTRLQKKFLYDIERHIGNAIWWLGNDKNLLEESLRLYDDYRDAGFLGVKDLTALDEKRTKFSQKVVDQLKKDKDEYARKLKWNMETAYKQGEKLKDEYPDFQKKHGMLNSIINSVKCMCSTILGAPFNFYHGLKDDCKELYNGEHTINSYRVIPWPIFDFIRFFHPNKKVTRAID